MPQNRKHVNLMEFEMFMFSHEEWSIIRDAVESEAFLLPEEESEVYGIIIDKIDAIFQYDEDRSSG